MCVILAHPNVCMYVHVFSLDTAFVLTTTRDRHFEKEDFVSSPFTC